MSNYKELIDWLRNEGCDDSPHCEHCPDSTCCELYMMNKAADAIEELSKKRDVACWGCKCSKIERNEWISVTERLPNEDGWYQVYAPDYSGGSSSGLKNINGNMYSAFKHGKWSIEVGYHKRPGCVKAWMPLPEPPKEKI